MPLGLPIPRNNTVATAPAIKKKATLWEEEEEDEGEDEPMFLKKTTPLPQAKPQGTIAEKKPISKLFNDDDEEEDEGFNFKPKQKTTPAPLT